MFLVIQVDNIQQYEPTKDGANEENVNMRLLKVSIVVTQGVDEL